MQQLHHRIITTTLICLSLVNPSLHAAAPTTQQLQNDIKSLQSKIKSLEARQRTLSRAPASSTRTANSTGNNQLNEINAKLDKIMQVLQITTSGVTIKSNGNMTIHAKNTLTVKSDSSLKLEGKAKADLKSGGAMTIDGQAITSIKGSIVKLNNGTKPIARVGSKTVGSSNSQQIIDGSTKVLVP